MLDSEEALIQAYRDWSKRSGELAAEARRWFPGGDTRMSAHYGPYPLFMERARGCRLFDVEGRSFIDFMNNFTSLLLGHAHPAVVEAVREQAGLGTAFAAPTRSQLELARMICERVPAVEQLRFTSSGTEATTMALRCARAVTGRQKILKVEGGYHGSYEQAEVSLWPRPDRAGPLEEPVPLAIDASIPQSVLSDTIVAPYNEPEIAARLVAGHAHELAAVIVEPVLASMGMLPAEPAFLTALREATREHEVLLIFDEVVSLRLGDWGAQQRYGVTPDLVAMGKIIGGGLPIGAIGGRRDLMAVFDPERREPVFHASTFSGNPLSMAAGLAALRLFTPELRARLDALGERLREGFGAAFARAGVRGQAVGVGSLTQLHLGDRPLRHARDTVEGRRQAGPAARLLHLSMLRRGVASSGGLMYCISAPMTESEIDTAVGALDESLAELRPCLARERPALLAG